MSILSFAKKLRRTRPASAAEKQPVKLKQPSSEPQQEKTKATASVAPTADVLSLHPVMSEKSVRLQEDNIVTFRVPHTATKAQVAQALRTRYQVEPREIRMLYGRAKERRRGRSVGRTTQWKKAYIKVDDVQAINAGP
jgi:large subunit ribosomal protein L23